MNADSHDTNSHDTEYRDDEQRLESLIRGAGHYIRPGDKLRGDILESVRVDVERKNRWRRWLASAGVAASLMMVVVISASMLLSAVPQGRTADDLFAQASGSEPTLFPLQTSSISESGTRWQWALSEVFHDWRRMDGQSR